MPRFGIFRSRHGRPKRFRERGCSCNHRARARTGDFDGDGVGDLLIAFTGGAGAVIPYGVDSLAAVDFAGPEDLSSYPAS